MLQVENPIIRYLGAFGATKAFGAKKKELVSVYLFAFYKVGCGSEQPAVVVGDPARSWGVESR